MTRTSSDEGRAPEDLTAAVGQRVREARATRGWTLDELAARSAVSRRMIVNVESGASNASIATLLRLAGALGVTLADLVAGPTAGVDVVVTRAAARQATWRGDAGGSAVLVSSAATPDMLELWDWTLAPGEAYESDAHRPGTYELIHVGSGQVLLTVDGHEHRLRAGDAASFAAGVAHRYANVGRGVARFSMTVFEPLGRVRP